VIDKSAFRGTGTQEVAAFIEGFASVRRLIHFGHVLHLLFA